MKKFALLLCVSMAALMVPQKVWADGITPNPPSGTEITITTSSPGQVSSLLTTYYTNNDYFKTNDEVNGEKVSTWKSTITKIILNGKFNDTDLSALSNASGFSVVATVDMSEAQFVKYGSSNEYQLFHTEEAATGSTSKSIVGGTLYQWVNSKSWDLYYGTINENSTIHKYADDTARDNDLTNRSVNDYGKVAKSGYQYVQMTVSNESWSYVTNNAPASSIYTVSWLDNELNSHLSEYSNGQSVRMKKYWHKEVIEETRHWILVNSGAKPSNAINGNHYGDGAVNANLDMNASEYGLLLGRCTNGEYMRFYVYYTKTNGTWTFDATKTNATSPQLYDYDADFLTKEIWESQNQQVDDGKVVRYTWYFQKQENYNWVECYPTSAQLSSAIVYDGKGVGATYGALDPNQGAVNSYIWFYVYSTKSDSRSWGTPQTTEPSGVESISEATFDYVYRDNHKSGYTNGQWVKMKDYDYYKVGLNGTPHWVEVSYTDGSVYSINSSFIFSSETTNINDGAHNGNSINQYAIVGNDIRNSSSFTPDYSQMKFSYWSGSITKAVTSKYADTSISNQIFSNCRNLNNIDYKSGNVTGLHDRKIAEGYSGNVVIKIGKDVTQIDASAFKDCEGLTTVTFDKDYSGLIDANGEPLSGSGYPKPMTIGENAFLSCTHLTGIEIPNRVTEIGNTAFHNAGNSIEGDFVLNFERRDKRDESTGNTVAINCNYALTIGAGAFEDVKKLKELSLPVRLTSMGNRAFANTEGLEKLEMRESTTSNIDDPGPRLATIPSAAFERSAVREITIPKSVTLIESGAFQQTNHLAKITFQEYLNPSVPQTPLVIKSGAFAGGDENTIPNLHVYVDINPDRRKIICEYNAFNFTQMEGQTATNNERRGTLHFSEAYWDYYQGDWKRGLTFSQSNLNAFKDGYNGTVKIDGDDKECIGMAGEEVKATDPNFAGGTVEGKYTKDLGEDEIYAPANGWQMFAGTSTGIDLVIPGGTFIRTYSTNTKYEIPSLVIGYGSEATPLVDIYRVTAFSDGFNSKTDNPHDRAAADAATRTATATPITGYIPKQTGLIMVGNVESGSGYLTYFKERAEDETNEPSYPYSPSGENMNYLMPTCTGAVDTGYEYNGNDSKNNGTNIVVLGVEDGIEKEYVKLNPTMPYPISGSDAYRIFGFRTDKVKFYRSQPGVLMERDRAYLKLPIGVFHWANEQSGESVPGQTPSSSRISLLFGEENDAELTGVAMPVKVVESNSDDSFYTIQGVKLSRPQGKGLYIYKGKKIYIK